MTATSSGSVVPWAPEDLPITAEELPGWSYVVLEEIVDDIALLRRWPWPVADQLGRLLWAEDDGDTDDAEPDDGAATVDLDLLTAQLYIPNGIERRPRCGDTYATRFWTRRGGPRHASDLRELIGEECYDISADAREAAKLTYQASLGAIQPATETDSDALRGVQETLRSRTENHLPALHVAPPPPPPPRRELGGETR